MDQSNENAKTSWHLERECELRFEVDQDKVITIVLISGSAEVFGIEMATNQEYSFTASKVAVFTWYGADLEMRGVASVAYTSPETPMVSYINTHAQLEARRERASNEGKTGPRVMIAGPTDSGKSTLTKFLLGYATRLSRCPVFVDVDVGQGEITVPGTVSAGVINTNCISIEDGLSLASPLVFFFGHNNLAENPALYKHLVTRLGECINMRFDNDPEVAASGMIVNTAGWVEELGYDLLLHCARALDIDTVLVMGADRLYAELTRDLNDGITVVKLPRSGGVVNRDTKFRRSARKTRTQEYFYGSPRPGGSLSPSVQEYQFSKLNIYRVGGVQISESMLPVGQKSTLDPLQISKVVLSQELVHTVLAVCHPVVMSDGTVMFTEQANKPDHELAVVGKALLSTNVAGFIYVTEVDIDKKHISFLSPCPGQLPSFFLLMGSLKWMQS